MSAEEQLLEEIRTELVALRRLEEARAKVEDGTPLSRREFCRLLGIDVESTLEPLIRARKVKTVPWTKGEKRLPVSELRRLQREGIPQLEQRKPSAPPRQASSTAAPDGKRAAANIRELKID